MYWPEMNPCNNVLKTEQAPHFPWNQFQRVHTKLKITKLSQVLWCYLCNKSVGTCVNSTFVSLLEFTLTRVMRPRFILELFLLQEQTKTASGRDLCICFPGIFIIWSNYDMNNVSQYTDNDWNWCFWDKQKMCNCISVVEINSNTKCTKAIRLNSINMRWPGPFS